MTRQGILKIGLLTVERTVVIKPPHWLLDSIAQLLNCYAITNIDLSFGYRQDYRLLTPKFRCTEKNNVFALNLEFLSLM